MNLTTFTFFLRRSIITLLILLVSLSVFSQSDLLNSTLDSAKQLRNVGEFELAANVLQDFNLKYPGNIWVMRLYAETLFWLKDYENAVLVYEEAIKTHPNDFDVKYEYALMLYDIGEYEKANNLLIIYTNKYQNIAVAESLLGITYYFLGSFNLAAQHLKTAVELNPNDKQSAETLNSVYHIIRPWLKASVFYNDDSQEISRFIPVLEGGGYYSAFFQPSFYLDFQNFAYDSISSYQINFLLSNSFSFRKIGLDAKLTAGINYASINQSVDFLWGINLKQKISKYFKIEAGAQRSAYTYTLASVNKPFLSNKYQFSLLWDKKNSWMAKTGYLAETFSDTNNVQSVYAWGLSPGLIFSIFEFRLGYAFSYSTSKESSFRSTQSLSKILDNYVDGQKIEGIYDPYFTPKNQFANSVLANVNIFPTNKIDIRLHASVGFYSKAENPYLYLDNNNGKIIIKQGFYQESYTPLDLGINLDYELSNNLYLNFSYKYLQTFYFNSNNFQLSLKKSF